MKSIGGSSGGSGGTIDITQIIHKDGSASTTKVHSEAAVATELVQLEQELGVVRGDVQGIQDNQQTNINSFGVSTTPSEIGGDYFVEMWFNTGNLNWTEEAKSNYIFAFGNSDGSQRCGLCYIYNKATLLFAYLGQGVGNSPTTYAIKPNTLYHFVVSRNGNLSEMWVNGVKLVSKEFNGIAGSYYNIINKVNIGGKGTISTYKIRRFNIATTQQLVDMLYNQGRCDEVVLGDEWRIEKKHTINNITWNPASWTSSAIEDFKRYTQLNVTSSLYGGVSVITNIIDIRNRFVKVSFDIRAVGNLDYVQVRSDNGNEDKININLTSEFVKHIVIFRANDTGNSLVIGRQGDISVSNGFDIKNISVENVVILNEYLPHNLTATKWIDNGVSKQDIAITAPTFTYVRPYKQYSFGSGAPTVNPDAAFVEYTDVDTGRVWKSGGKPNTRQFDLNDYGIIKQGRS